MSEFVNEEYGVPFEAYLNLYHGMEIDKTRISHYQNMTEAEKEKFESFVEEVGKVDWNTTEGLDPKKQPIVVPDEMTCLRFLQADKYDSKKAMKRIIATQKWQQEWNLASVISTKPEKLDQYRKLRARAYMGRTIDNSMPILCERLGHFMCAIPSKEGKELSDKEYVECFLYDLALMIKVLRESYELNIDKDDKPLINWNASWIMDAKSMSFYRAMKAVSTIKLLDSMTDPNFPEFAGPVYIINVPSVVSGVWRVVKAFLDPSTVEKIGIHSGCPTEILKERMDQATLFEEFGGENKGEFPQAEYS